MKRIIIFQENTSPVEMMDPDTSDLEEYTKNLQKVLDSGNVSMLTTPLSSLIIKPSKIISILVQEVVDVIPPDEGVEMQSIKVEKVDGKKEEEQNVDIVTDIDE